MITTVCPHTRQLLLADYTPAWRDGIPGICTDTHRLPNSFFSSVFVSVDSVFVSDFVSELEFDPHPTTIDPVIAATNNNVTTLFFMFLISSFVST